MTSLPPWAAVPGSLTLTEAQYEGLPDRVRKLIEVIDGNVIFCPGGTPEHADVTRTLAVRLDAARPAQPCAEVSTGRLPPGPWFLTGVPAEASGVKRDFACTLTCPFPPELVALRSRSRLMLEGARTHSKPTPDLRPAKGSRTLALSGNVPGTIRA